MNGVTLVSQDATGNLAWINKEDVTSTKFNVKPVSGCTGPTESKLNTGGVEMVWSITVDTHIPSGS